MNRFIRADIKQQRRRRQQQQQKKNKNKNKNKREAGVTKKVGIARLSRLRAHATTPFEKPTIETAP